MFSEYFIDRPRFAGVISVIMILLGLLAIAVLPVSQYPQITPPQIVVSTTYSGSHCRLCFPDYAEKVCYQSLGNVYDRYVYIPVPVNCHFYYHNRHGTDN